MYHLNLDFKKNKTLSHHEKVIANIIINDWMISSLRIHNDVFNWFSIVGHVCCV